MKIKLLTFIVISIPMLSIAQSSPPTTVNTIPSGPSVMTISDTMTFYGMPSYTTITNQYLYTGAFCSGYNGSFDPVTYDYGTTSYGSVMHSDNWFNALRINFVDPNNQNLYVPINHVEFDNPIAVTETDYMSVDIYDFNNALLLHYMSTSPEHVVINFSTCTAAYMVLDDSAGTAYVVDNILFSDCNLTGISSAENETGITVYPVPSKGELNISANFNVSTSS